MATFSQLNIPKTKSNIDPSPLSAKDYLRGTISQLLDIYDRGVDRWMLLPQEIARSEEIIGRRGRYENCLASNMGLRLTSGGLLIDLCRQMELNRPERCYFLVTLISDRWLSFDRDTYIWLEGMRRTVRPVMALGGFDGWFSMLEIQSLDETVRGLGRILLPHAHAIAWSDDPAFSPEAAEQRMASSRRLVSRIGAKTVHVSYRADTSPCNLAAYIIKAACLAKYREPCIRSPSGIKLSDTALPPVSAVRQIEILSGIYFDELMLSGGDGAFLRVELKRAMLRNASRSGIHEMSIERARLHWSGLRRRTGRDDNYWPVDIDRSGKQLPFASPITLACARFTRKQIETRRPAP
jgi:hypothetical protein